MKIFCIGRNYADHAKELNNPIPDNPLVFCKLPTALLINNKPFYHPDFSKDVHHELEVVLRIKKNGRNISERFAHKYYDEIGLGIDFTARDIQNQLKAKGHPWEIAKSFDSSAPLGQFMPVSEIGNIHDIDFKLLKNKELVQHGNTKDLLFSFDRLISYLSKYFLIQQGDLIYTGTPAGVASVKIGDTLEGFIGEKKLLHCEIR